MARAIDHLVLAVPDLDRAVDRYRALGFLVGAQNRHPWGTVNAIVQLDGATFLELIGLGPGFAIPDDGDPAAPFARPVAAAVARGGGLALLALRSQNADADAEAFRACGSGSGRRLDFARTDEAANGTRRTIRFSLAFAEGLRDAGVFTCRHHDAASSPSPARHPNGASRLVGVSLVLDEPERHRDRLAALLEVDASRPDGGPDLALDGARLDLVTPSQARARYGIAPVPNRFALFTLAVRSAGRVRRRLDAANLPHNGTDDILVVPPEAAFGTALAFIREA